MTVKKILVVDDNNGEMIKKCLGEIGFSQENGYEVEIAEDSVAAIEKIRKTSYLFVTMDGYLEGDVTGPSVVRAIRNFNRNVPVIMLSAANGKNFEGVCCGANIAMNKQDFVANAHRRSGRRFKEALENIGIKI